MARFLFRAQERNMTNGDFAYFTFRAMRSFITDRPWNLYVDDPADLPRRRQAFYAVKQVRIQCVDFYRAMLCIRGTRHGPVSVCLSVCVRLCLLQVGVLLKRQNVGSHKQHRTIPQGV